MPELLTDVRVLSLGQILAGNVAAQMLAELGADVIKVESPARPDPLRQRIFRDHEPLHEPGGAETSAAFGGVARSQRGLALDLRQEADRDRFLELVRTSDVVLENFRAGVIEQWGLGFDVLSAANPRIVLASLSGFGRGGPRDHFVAYGGNISGFTGMSSLVGRGNPYHHDYVGAVHLAVAVLGGLAHRDRAGEAVALDLSQSETGASLMGVDFLAQQLAAPIDATREIHQVVRAGDGGWLAVSLCDAADRVAVAHVIDARPDADWFALEADGIVRALADWAGERPAEAAAAQLARAGVAAAPVNAGRGVSSDPQLRARGAFVEIDHPDIGLIEYPASPHRLDGAPVAVRSRAPRLGEHTAQILGDTGRRAGTPAEPRA